MSSSPAMSHGRTAIRSLRHPAFCLFALALAACTATGAKGPAAATGASGAAPNITDTQKAADQPLQVKDMRVVVRSAAEVVAMAKQSTAGSVTLVTKPLTDDLFQVLVFDSPPSLRYATTGDLDQLKLSAGDALSTGLQNLATGLPPLASVTHDLAPHQIGLIQGSTYESSRILLAKDWATLAQELDGHLLVAIPASDTILYAEENGAQSVRALASLARDSAGKAPRAVSADLLRWSPAGWQKVSVP